jgi:hypothetical protein
MLTWLVARWLQDSAAAIIAISIDRAERPWGEVLTSSVLKDLVAGSGLSFEDRGMHTFKGLTDEVRIFAAGTPAVM